MIAIDHAFAHLLEIQAAGWKAPPDHPDLVPAAEAGLLADLLRNLEEDHQVQEGEQEMLEWMVRSAAEASHLEEGIVEGFDTAELSARLQVIDASCKSCHVKHRDN